MNLNKKLNIKLKNHMDLITSWDVVKDGKEIQLKFVHDYQARRVWDYLLDSALFKTSMTIDRILIVKEAK